MRSAEPVKEKSSGTKEFSTREFPMFDEDFQKIKAIAKQKTGIELGEHKKEMIYSRIVRCIRQVGLLSFSEYLNYLEANLDLELTNFINAITTNLTSFFREKHHFDYLKATVLPDLMQSNLATKKLRIWSAGCSTGEEPYSIAIVLDSMLNSKHWDARILATDLDTNVINHGRKGVYTGERIGNLEDDLVRKYFRKPDGVQNNSDASMQVKDSLKQYVCFNRLNLLGDWPMKGKFDVIFCRNVVIYFSKDTQRILFERYADILQPNGFLFIGHSESLHGISKRFESLGRTVYRKKC